MLIYPLFSKEWMRKGIVLIITVLLVIPLFQALPILDHSQEKPEQFACSTYQSAQKTFDAEFAITSVGLACKSSALVTLFECVDAECQQLKKAGSAYKINNHLPQFSNYIVGNNYHYQCYTCKDPATNHPPTITAPSRIAVTEGEKVVLNAVCTDEDDDVVSGVRYAGWMNIPTKMTGYTDAGAYQVTLTCEDEFQGRTVKTVQVVVADANRPPQIVTVKNN